MQGICLTSKTHTWPCGVVQVVVIVSANKIKDRGFESLQGVRFFNVFLRCNAVLVNYFALLLYLFL
jgi:hypothetical protein